MRPSFPSFFPVSSLRCVAASLLLSILMVPALASPTSGERLQDSVRELNRLRFEIEEERTPLVRELETLRRELGERRSTLRDLRSVRDSRTIDLETLEDQVRGWREQLQFSRSLLDEFARGLEDAIPAAEWQVHGSIVTDYHRAVDDAAGDLAPHLEAGHQLLAAALKRIETRRGGLSFSGESIFRGGTVESGTLFLFGPVAYFLTDDGERGGLLDRPTGLQARIAYEHPRLTRALRNLAAAREAVIDVDPTLGRAVAMEGARESYLQRIAKGGVWIFPILLFGVVAAITAIGKAIQIYTIRLPEPARVDAMVRALKRGDTARAREMAHLSAPPARSVLSAAVEHAREPRDMIEEALFEQVLLQRPGLERFLPLIAVTAATAPLLGLLGTVTGMIHTFQNITLFGTGDARLLSSGISEALVTTEFGLMVAIPSLLLHALLSRKSQGILSEMEHLATSLINGLSSPARGPDPE